jgi:hypothetical protein
MKYDFLPLLEWLRKQSEAVSLADLTISIKIHDGKIALIERTVTEKSKPTTGNTGGAYERN